jgi:hypothetical protein
MKQRTLLKLSMLILTTLIASPVVTAVQLSNHFAKDFVSNNAIEKLVVDEANRQGVEPALALAMAEVESNFNPRALSKAGAKGVMQIMPATAEKVFGVSSDQLFDAKINIKLGIAFIKKLLTRYNQRLDIALSHYNGGSAVQDKQGRLSVIPATRKYVSKVIAAQERFTYKAYQLSSTALPQGKINTTADTNNRTRVLPTTNTLVNKHISKVVREVSKPEQLYSATNFDDSLYQKMEQLRTLRLRNIMRNTLGKSARNTSLTSRGKISSPHGKNFRKNNSQIIKESAKPLSVKRKKVLSWEAMFD